MEAIQVKLAHTQAASSRDSSLRYIYPDVNAYGQQQGFDMATAGSRPEFLEYDTSCRREVFEQRMRSLLGEKNIAAPSIYPGNLIPESGRAANFVDRGTFLFDQHNYFRSLGWFNSSGATTIESTATTADVYWPWKHIGKPQLEFVDSSTAHRKLHPNAPEYRHHSLADQLQWVHALWDEEPAYYSEGTLNGLSHWFSKLSRTSQLIEISALFEIEAYAAYMTATANLRPMISGTFAGNYMDVLSVPISRMRQTEFCITSRVLAELLNLHRSRFAPVIINEYCCIADGNHRITALQIWMLLQNCETVPWDLDCAEFQQQIRAATYQTHLDQSPVSLHEALGHIARLLANKDSARRLENALRPQMHYQRPDISEIPAILVPEYNSCAVKKVPYDSGEGIIRAHPAIYRAMASNPNFVLQPRAVYHYTDRVLLPWFNVLKTPEDVLKTPRNKAWSAGSSPADYDPL